MEPIDMSGIDRAEVLPAMRHALDAMRRLGHDPGEGTVLSNVVRLTERGDVDGLMAQAPVTVVSMVHAYRSQ